jgi:hypothetical protein
MEHKSSTTLRSGYQLPFILQSWYIFIFIPKLFSHSFESMMFSLLLFPAIYSLNLFQTYPVYPVINMAFTRNAHLIAQYGVG